MSKKFAFRTPNVSRGLKNKLELQGNEYGKAGKGIIVCHVCHDVFFKKGWHKPGSISLKEASLSGQGVHFALCPADRMKKGGLFGGKISIRNVPLKEREDLYNLIAGFGKRAELRNPQDRIMDIKTSGGNFNLTTNNDQLAAKLGKKIKETFKKANLKISFQSEPNEVSRVEIDFA